MSNHKQMFFLGVAFIVFLTAFTKAHACNVTVNVTNESGHKMFAVQINGPWLRVSDKFTLLNGESFSYNATGSAFSCHGAYRIDSEFGRLYRVSRIINAPHDMTVNAVITNKCHLDSNSHYCCDVNIDK